MILDVVTKGTTDYSCTIRIVDSADGTPETGVLYNTAGIDLWYRRPGAAHSSITEATQTEAGAHSDGGFVHISDGYYRLDLPDAAVASGVDYVDVGGVVTGMIVIGGRIRLTDVDLDDATRGGLTALPNANADAAGGLPISDAGGLDMDSIKTDTAAILVDTGTTLPATLTTIDTVVDGIQTDLDNATDGLGAIKTDTAAILVDTNSLNDTKIPDTISLANINAQVDTALTDIGLDHLVGASVTGTDVTDNSIIARLVSASATADWDDFVNTTDSLQALRDRGDAAWTTGGGGSITDIVNWSFLVPSAIDLANTKSYRLAIAVTNAVDNLPTTAEITPGTISIDRAANGGTSWSAVVTDAACSELDGVIYYDEVFDTATGYVEGDMLRVTFKGQYVTVSANDYNITPTGGHILYSGIVNTLPDVNIASISDSAPAADALELFALALNQGTGQLDSGTFTADTITSTAIQDGAFTSAKFGTVPADVVSISGDTVAADNLESYTDGTTPMPVNTTQISGDATAADNAEAFFDNTGFSASNSTIGTATVAGSVTGAVGSVTGNVDGNVTGSVGSLAAQAQADVNAEVLDVLNTDTFAELASVPAANAPLAQKINWLFALSRNRITQTSTTQTLRNDADTGNIATSTQSDDATTYARAEWT